MNRLLCTLTIILLFFSSCSKQIEGRVVDNFGNPLKDVEISIVNTQYTTQSNSNGEYAIDYASGEVLMKFRKGNYIGTNEVLYIAEKQLYPLKDIKLTKSPTQHGIYVASNEKNDYIRLNPQRGVKAKKGNRRNTINFYLTNTDSLNIIKLSSLDDIRFHHYLIKSQLLGIVDTDNKIAELSQDVFFYSVKANNPVKEKIDKLNSNMNIHTFKPQFNTTYVYIFEAGFKNNRNPNLTTYLFRFEQE